MNIIHLSVKNFMRIQSAQIDPSGNVTIIGGDNAQGKTSILNAISALFMGKDAFPAKPVREGADKAELAVDCGDFTLALVIKPDGSSALKITTKEGHIVAKPQTWLNEKIGKLSFDPLAFTRLPEKEQAETLRKLVGVDVSDLDGRKATLFAQRTQVGRDRDAAAGAVQTLPQHDHSAPDAEVSASAVMAELTEAQDLVRRVDAMRAEADRLEADARGHDARVVELKTELDAVDPTAAIEAMNADIDRQIAALEDRRVSEKVRMLNEAIGKKSDLSLRIANNENRAGDNRAKASAFRTDAAAITLPDVDAIRAKAADVDVINRKVRANAQLKAAEDLARGHRLRYQAMTEELDAIATERAKRIQAAVYPIAGLAFDEGGVVQFDGVPLSQASRAQQIRVSMAIALAMNPQLRVVLIRDASLIGAKELALISQIAEESQTQLFLERVGEGDEGAIIIDDGLVRAPVAKGQAPLL